MIKRIATIILTGFVIFGVWMLIDWYINRDTETLSESRIEELVQACISSSAYMLSQHEYRAHDICHCAVEELINTYSSDELEELHKLEPDDFHVFVLPYLEQCRASQVDIGYEEVKDKYEDQMNQCLDAFTARVGRENAIGFCECFVPYLIEKYGYENLHLKDSIIALEVDKITECADFLE